MPLLADGSIFRDPAGWGYPDLPAGTIREPKFGYIFVENRDPTKRRTKLVVCSHPSASNPALIASHFVPKSASAAPLSCHPRRALTPLVTPRRCALTPHIPQTPRAAAHSRHPSARAAALLTSPKLHPHRRALAHPQIDLRCCARARRRTHATYISTARAGRARLGAVIDDERVVTHAA